MLTFRMFAFLAAASLVVGMSSCVPSDNPLSDPDHSEPDPDLYGIWIRGADNSLFAAAMGGAGPQVRVVGRAGRFREDLGSFALEKVPAGIMRYVQTEFEPDQAVQGAGTKDFFVTKLGCDRYLNEITYHQQPWPVLEGKKAWDKRRIEGYLLWKYHVAGDKLTIWGGDVEALAREIENGKLRGNVQRDKYKSVSSVQLKEATANLVKYLENGGGAVLFPDSNKTEYVRMRIVQNTISNLSDSDRKFLETKEPNKSQPAPTEVPKQGNSLSGCRSSDEAP